jgi:hypothetical protein
MRDELSGTTAICVLLKDKKIYCVSKQDIKRERDESKSTYKWFSL